MSNGLTEIVEEIQTTFSNLNFKVPKGHAAGALESFKHKLFITLIQEIYQRRAEPVLRYVIE